MTQTCSTPPTTNKQQKRKASLSLENEDYEPKHFKARHAAGSSSSEEEREARYVEMTRQTCSTPPTTTKQQKRKTSLSLDDEDDEPKHSKSKHVAESSSSSEEREARSEIFKMLKSLRRFEQEADGEYPFIMRLIKEQEQLPDSSQKMITSVKKVCPLFSTIRNEDIKAIFGKSKASDYEKSLKKATLARLKWKARETAVIAEIMRHFVSFFEYMETGSLS